MTQRAGATSVDPEIKDEMEAAALEYGVGIRRDGTPAVSTWVFTTGNIGGKRNPVISILRRLGLWNRCAGSKFIPHDYKVSSRKDRLELLAGLIDTDGHLHTGCFDFISKSVVLANDLAFVARSLGFAASIRECLKSAHASHVGTYHRVSISGDISHIPCRIKRKQCGLRIQKKSVLRTGFKINKLGIEPFYGFTLDGDGRYLLGDFTVTHNSGKSYCATKLCEEMLDNAAQVVALDPVGVWYGLRVGGHYSIAIFGGLHGDVPLEPGAGEFIANLIVDRGISAVLDVSQFEGDAQKARFAKDFASRFFFRKKSSPSAVHVFLEEAQEFVPQNPQRDEALMLHAFTRLAKLGRNFGIGVTLITQRPQEVNKKVLNLTECLLAFQLTGPHERKTIESWIQEKGINEDIRELLPHLRVGQCHFWSPQWLRVNKTIQIAKKKTADVSSTPTVGATKKVEPRPLAPEEFEKFSRQMQETIERAKAEDPRELRKKIAELERERNERLRIEGLKPQIEIKRVEVPILKADERAAILRLDELLGGFEFQQITDALGIIRQHLVEPTLPKVSEIRGILKSLKSSVRDSDGGHEHDPIGETKRAPRSAPSLNGDISGAQQRILNEVAKLHRLGVAQPTVKQVAVFCGVSHSTGTFLQNLRDLDRDGYLTRSKGTVMLTVLGDKSSEHSGLSGSNPLEMWCHKLDSPRAKMLKAIYDMGSVTKTDLAAALGVSPSTGSFLQNLRDLRNYGIIEIENGVARPSDLIIA